MYTASLILKNKTALFKIVLINILLLFPVFSIFAQQPRFSIPIFTPPTQTQQQSVPVESSPGSTTTQTRSEIDKEYIPSTFPAIFIGPTFGLSYFNIVPMAQNSLPEWNGIEFNGGAFFDLRFTKRLGFKISYEYQLAYNVLASDEPGKKFHLVNVIAKYILAYKHQLWIGLGATFHIFDKFAHSDLNIKLVNAGIISDQNIETEKKVIIFFTIYMGYMLELSKSIVFDVQVSYGLINSNLKLWRYNSFRINLGFGFKI